MLRQTKSTKAEPSSAAALSEGLETVLLTNVTGRAASSPRVNATISFTQAIPAGVSAANSLPTLQAMTDG